MTAQKVKTGKNRVVVELYEWAGVLTFALTVAVTVFAVLFFRISVEGSSMENTLRDGDRLIISNIGYNPKDGDIVVCYIPKLKKTIVKRVIAVGGETVKIDYTAHRVYVNDNLLDEPYIKEETAFIGLAPQTDMPLTVPDGSYFVMGDNRNVSVDSRSGSVGLIKRNQIFGKAVIRYFPIDKINIID